MRIDLNAEAQLLPELSRTANQNASSAAGQSSAASPVGQDQAQVSGVYTEIRALAGQASQLPEAGEEKVSALREMVLGGSYQPSAGQVAQALFAHMLVQPSS
ncbi:MAG: flagellar biosynthesis anti-sigma factor FlgM [Candidatus Sulfotelmatobacter sp.]